MYDILQEIFKDHKDGAIFNCFGIWHILYIVVVFSSIITLLIVLKNKKDNIKIRVINILIDFVFSLYILDFFIMPLAYGAIDLEKLPFHICTITCVLCFLSRHIKFLSKYKITFAVVGLIGNLIYVIYPAGVGWYQISAYSYRVIQTLLFHALMSCYGVLTLAFDSPKLEWKKCYKELFVIIGITIWAIIGNSIYNSSDRVYNWFFVIQDPFYIIDKTIAPYVMPFIMVVVIYFANMLVYLSYFGVKKVVNIRNK